MDSLVRTDIARRVIQLRERRRLTQEDLAREAGITRSWLSQVESGDIKAPGGDRLTRLANALGVSTDFLLNGDRGQREVMQRVPADAVGRVGQFLRASPKVQEALVRLIEPLEHSFGLPIEKVDRRRSRIHDELAEDAAEGEAEDQQDG